MEAEDVDDLLRRASAAHRLAMERALAPFELTPAQHAVLKIVVERPGVSGAEAARIERLSPPTLSVIVQNLLRKGLATRRPHSGNARILCLEPTDLGREMAKRAEAKASEVTRDLLAVAPEGAAGAIKAWLSRVAEAPA